MKEKKKTLLFLLIETITKPFALFISFLTIQNEILLIIFYNCCNNDLHFHSHFKSILTPFRRTRSLEAFRGKDL